MNTKGKRVFASWQLERLIEFARYEREESAFYEIYYENTSQKIPLKVMTVMFFFLQEQYQTRAGSLVTLYRVSKREDIPVGDFNGRYELYYDALQEWGYL